MEQAEQIQREMGKLILRCSPKMTNEVVLGELGWWTLKGRRDFLTLNYWGEIVGGCHLHVWSIMSITPVAHDTTPITTKPRITAQTDGVTFTHYSKTLAWKTHGITTHSHQTRQNSGEAQSRKRSEKRKKRSGRKECNTNPSCTYHQLKTQLRFEPYLTTKDREEREVMTRLRGGTNELRIETGRYAITNRDRPLKLRERRSDLYEWRD